MPIFSEWTFVMRALAPIAQKLPRWFLRKRFPSARMSGMVDIVATGLGPYLAASEEGVPGMSGLTFTVYNRLPFPVTLDWIQLDVCVETYGLIALDQHSGQSIAPQSTGTVTCRDTALTEGHAQVLRGLSIDGPQMRVSGKAHFQSLIGEFDKRVECQTRGFIYRGMHQNR